jgi:hypothetical protein
MNRFCENCGHALSKRNLFCEECGSPIEAPPYALDSTPKHAAPFGFALFAPSASESERQDAIHASRESPVHGLMVTNLSRLQAILGSEYQLFIQSLSEYAHNALNRGVCYHVLDVSLSTIGAVTTNDWKEHVDLIDQAVGAHEQHTGKALQGIFLLGGQDVIPMAVYENQTGDPDRDIESDLAYSTLFADNPWCSGPRGLIAKLYVGRLPISTNTGLSLWQSYASNVLAVSTRFSGTTAPFGLSAKQWERASAHVFGDIFAQPVHTSPAVNLRNIENINTKSASFQYYNLHGADEEPYWYGQLDSDYPIAFSPDVAAQSSTLNVIGVEACYGSRFIDLLTSQSILLSSLSKSTVAFLGSSRIAFGPAEPPIGLADVIVHQFLSGMRSGMMAGSALNAGRKAVLGSPTLDPTGVKTVLEFNLFGDPLLAVTARAKSVQEPKSQPFENERLVALPDVLGVAQSAVDEVRDRIRTMIDSYVYQRYPVLDGVEPSSSKVLIGTRRSAFTRYTYHAKHGPLGTTVLVYADEDGNITQELVSK